MASDLTPDALSQLIFTDDLTGIYNRRYLYSYLTRRVDWKDRSRHFSLMMCDLDHFKNINDTYGHLEGDHAVKTLAGFLKELVRPEDMLVRYGGDEFCALLPGVDPSQAIQMAETIRTRVAGQAFTRRCDGQPFKITVSVGVSTFPDHAEAPDKLIDEADKALYQSKHRGRNCASSAGEIDGAVVASRDPFVGLPCPALVGRDKESEAIRAQLAELRRGRNGMILFSGAAGTGKSRMLREITRWAKDEGMIYLFARCTEALMESPYSLLFRLVESYVGDQADSAERLSKRLAPQELAVLREFIPSLKNVPLTEIVSLDDRDRRRALYEGLVGLLWDMTQHQPLVLLLDNLEFADRGTLEVLRWLLRPRAARLLVAGALPREAFESESFRDSFLAQLLEEVGRNGSLTRLDLPALKAEETGRMARSMLPDSDFPPDFEKHLARASEGNPLYVEESIRGLLLLGKIAKEGPRWRIGAIGPEDLPATLDGAIQRVFSHLPEETAEFLTNAAIVGGDFDLRLLKEVMGTNLGRAQEAADRAHSTRMVVPSSGGAPDEYTFLNRKSEETRYRATPEPRRRDIHEKIARAEEKRHKDTSQVADLLAYHYEKGGDARKAEEYKQISKSKTSLIYRSEEASEYARRRGERTPRVPEGTRAPSPAALKKIETFLKAFCGALKMLRLYPQWSRLSNVFMTQLRAASGEMLAESGTVTFVADLKKLRANGTALDGRGGVSMADDMAAILHDHLIAGLTLGEKCEPRELDLLVNALAEPLDRAAAKPDHWDAFLEANRVERFDIVQRIYVAHDTETMLHVRELSTFRERPLEPREVSLLAPALRHLKAGIDNVKLYPPGHQLVEAALDGAHQAWTKLLSTARIVTLAEADSALLANGTPLDAKVFSDAGEGIARLIRVHKLRSFSLLDGLTRDEVGGLVSAFSLKPEEANWNELPARLGARHVRIGERRFQLQQTGRREAAPQRPSPPAKDAATRAREWLAAPPSELLTEKFEKEFPVLLESLLPSGDAALGRELIDRLLRWTGDVDPKHRGRAWSLFHASVKTLDDRLRKGSLEHAAGMIALRGEGETAPESWKELLEVAELRICDMAADRDWSAVQALVEALRKRISRPGFEAAMAQTAESMLSRATDRGTFAPLLEAVKSGRPAEMEQASALLGAIGSSLLPALSGLLPELPGFPARRAVHAAIKRANFRAVGDLVRSLVGTGSSESARRILEVADLSDLPDAVEISRIAVLHSDPEVSSEAFRMVRRLPVELAARVVQRVLEGEAKTHYAPALACAADLHIESISPAVVKLLEQSRDEKVIGVCCQYLGRNPAAGAVGALARVLRTRPRFLGLIKGFSAETRAAAAWALAAVGTDEARGILETEALNDRNPAVRSAAKAGRK